MSICVWNSVAAVDLSLAPKRALSDFCRKTFRTSSNTLLVRAGDYDFRTAEYYAYMLQEAVFSSRRMLAST